LKISVIIPFLNEAQNLICFKAAIDDYFINNFKENKLEVIFVDDGSTDDSVKIIKDFGNLNFDVKVIKLSKNYGSHAALRAGIMNANGDYLMFLYADLQDPIELIDRLTEKMNLGNDIVWANRKSTTAPLFERLFSIFYSGLMRKFALSNYPEKGFDVVMFNRKVADALNRDIQVNSSLFLQILSLGFKQDSIEYDKVERKHGKSKWTLNKKIKLLVDSFVAFSFAPIRLVTIVGITLFVGGLLFSLYLLMRKVFFHDLVSGWTMLMTTLSLGFGITNISLGIIAEYLWRTFDAARGRSAFIIDEIIDLKNE
jgi:glycosyltransferase involved in cell wall biosynthesis